MVMARYCIPICLLFFVFFDLAAVRIAFCTCFLVCFQRSLDCLLLDCILLMFSRANLQVRRLRNKQKQKSPCFVDLNKLATDSDIIYAFFVYFDDLDNFWTI